MQNWEEVWNKQFGPKTPVAFDFSGEKIIRKLFRNYKLSHSWDIYYVERNSCIIVSSKIFEYMPKHWKNSFFVNGKEYQFIKNQNGDFEILLLRDTTKEKTEFDTLSVVMDQSYLFDVNEFSDDTPLVITESNYRQRVQYLNSFPGSNVTSKSNIKQGQTANKPKSIQSVGITQPINITKSIEHIDNFTKPQETIDDILDDGNTYISNEHIDNFIKPQETIKEIVDDGNSYISKEKREKFKRVLAEKNNKIWESFFGDEVIITDFTGRQITKYECDMGTKNSWKVDYYTNEDEERFIASAEVIDKRAGRRTFEIDDVEYNIVVVNGKYAIINSRQPDKILLSPELLCKEIEKYFPSFLTDYKVPQAPTPNYSSLLINLSEFPIKELEKLRNMLQKFLKEIDVFQDIFIYSTEQRKFDSQPGDNAYIRIFFKSESIDVEDIKIFDLCVILKNIFSIVMNNVRTIYNLSNSTNFTMFLSNHNKEYKYVSWFTSHSIDKYEKRPVRVNRGELIVDQFYFDWFVKLKGHKNSFITLKSKTHKTFYLCNLDINNMTSYIEELINKNRNRNIWY